MDQNCIVEPIQKSALDHVIQSADRILLLVSGMGCPHCATRVRNGLLLLDGVHDAEVLLNMRMAEVYFDEKKVSVEMLVQAVAGAGNDGRHHYQAHAITS
jgi:copper chaperone CopZ